MHKKESKNYPKQYDWGLDPKPFKARFLEEALQQQMQAWIPKRKS